MADWKSAYGMAEGLELQNQIAAHSANLAEAINELRALILLSDKKAQEITDAETGLYESATHDSGLTWPRKKETLLKELQAMFLAEHLDEYDGTKDERKQACISAFLKTEDAGRLLRDIETAERKVSMLKDELARLQERKAGVTQHLWTLRTEGEELSKSMEFFTALINAQKQ